MSMKRREFLKGGLAIAALGATMPSVLVRTLYAAPGEGPGPALTGAADGAGPTGKRTLVVLQLGGGNDGLNTLPPYLNGAYHDQRRDMALDLDDGVIALSDGVALHPALATLTPYWSGGQLAVVQNVGYPQPNRSHFRSMDIWQTAEPEALVREGWLGRCLDRNAAGTGNQWRAVSVGATQALALAGETFVPSMNSVEEYQLLADPHQALDSARRLLAWQTLHEQAGARTGSLPLLSRTGLDAFASAEELQGVASAYTPLVEYPQGNTVAAALLSVAQVVDAGLGTSIGYVTMSGFDTHANQPDQHANLLGQVAEGLAAFLQDIALHGHADDVLVLAFSEFGRRVGRNGSGGTDHGTAGPVFLLGNRVNGGLYGDPPDLRNLDDGDLQFSTDFRSVYAAVLEQWLDTEAASVLRGGVSPLPLLAG